MLKNDFMSLPDNLTKESNSFLLGLFSFISLSSYATQLSFKYFYAFLQVEHLG